MHLIFCDTWSYNTEIRESIHHFRKLVFCYCQLNYPADRIRNPVFDNKYGSLKMHHEAFADGQQYMGTFKHFPKQFRG